MIPSRLPFPWTEFVGRARERALLKRLLSRARLVTVVGMPGVGKSRLARQALEDVRTEWDGEIWSISCEGLESAEAVLLALQEAGAMPISAADRWEQVVPQLADRRVLLLLDSPEGLPKSDLRDLLSRLLSHARGVSILLTSLTPLDMEGEHLLPVRPMVPSAEAELQPASDAWLQADAIRLFEVRAQERDCEWQLSRENLPTVVALCREVDWLPLGIELVAGQLSPWTETQVLEQIQQRGHQLDLGAPGDAGRHGSLRRAIAWSWSLLPPVQRDMVRTVAAAGGQAFEEALEPLAGIPEAPLLAAILFRKGVLQKEQRAGRLRYVLPLTVRRFTLDESPALCLDMARAAAFYLELARREGGRLRTTEAATAAETLRLETPMLERCWQWAMEQSDAGMLREFALALWTPLIHELPLSPAAETLAAAAMEQLPEAGDERARLAWVAGAVASRLGFPQTAATRLRECLETQTSDGVRGLALRELGRLQLQQGQALAARESLQQSVTLLDGLGMEEEAAWARRSLAAVLEALGDRGSAARLLEEAWLVFQELDLSTGQAYTSIDLARLAADEGRWEDAEARGQAAVSGHELLGHASGVGRAMLQLARVRVRAGDIEQAQRLYQEALERLRSAGTPAELCHGLLQAAAERDVQARPLEPTRAYRECIDLSRERGLRSLLAHALRGLAGAYTEDGRNERALTLAQEAVRVARETTETPLIQACLELLARIHKAAGSTNLTSLTAPSGAAPIRVDSLAVREVEPSDSTRPDGARRTTITARTLRSRASNWPPVASSQAEAQEGHGPMRVRLLGGMSLFFGDEEVPMLDWWAKAKKLFAYLVIHRNRPISRDILLEEFWPDGDQHRAIHSLQTTLSFLRRSLRSLPGGPVLANRLIVARDGNYLFDTEGRCESDLQLFEYHWQEGTRLKAAGQTEAAAEHWMCADQLYVGDLLPDFPYEDWCASPRERLRSQYLDLLLDLARYQRQNQKPREALRTTERMFTIDSCDERAHRMAMRCHVQLGRPVDALRQYERCCQVLDRELRVQPSRATRELHETIRQRMMTPAPGPSPSDQEVSVAAGAP